MASPDRSIRPRLGSTASPCQSPSLPDDLLKEIFLRISSPVDLARASAACVTFRRLIADPSFIRRYRSLHPPLLLGFLDIDGFQPIEAPHPSAALARSIARAAYFSFDDYLPRGRKGYRWIRRDVREGRVLLESGAGYEVIPDLAVCDPLSRRYLLLPPIPDDLLASFQAQEEDAEEFYAFLVPSEGKEDDTVFRVIARINFAEVMVVFIFSSGTGHWSGRTSDGRNALRLPHDDRVLSWSSSYAHGCFYWKVFLRNILVKFNMSNLEFSTVDHPPDDTWCDFIIVESGEGMHGIFTRIDNCSLLYKIGQIGGEMSDHLIPIPLPIDYTYCIDGPYEGYIFILGYPMKETDTEDMLCFFT
ncbi:unnamed protein product [Urochloa humidicola]